MKNRTLLGLLLSVILAVPVFAQDNNSNSQTATSPNSASQTSMSTSNQSGTKADSATGKEPLQPASREGFWGHMNPFARKKYVARQTEPHSFIGKRQSVRWSLLWDS